MEGCALASDGLAVRVRQPFKSELRNTIAYCYRKGDFALIVMAGCDVNGVLTTLLTCYFACRYFRNAFSLRRRRPPNQKLFFQ